MKHLLLLLFCAVSLEAQLFPGKAARIRSGSGAPAVGECVSADDTDRLWVDKSAIPTTAHICRQTSSGVFSWDVLEAAGGSLDGDLTAIAALSCSNTQIIVRAGGAWTCGTAPAATGSSLAQFASTTSLELAGVISNETGSGALVLGTAPTISSAVLTLPLVTTYVAAGLPTAGTAGRLAILTDSTDGTCTTSGGSTRVWCFDTGSTWVSLTGTSGGSGSTAETYCVPSISSGNLLISTPCKVLVNNVELTFGSNMTCDASSGSGTILFGVQGTTAYCWHNVTLTATNATALGSTTAFPADACALASATVTSGTVSDPVNIRLGRACPVFTSSSTATASADPSTGALQVDLVLSGTAEEVAVSGGTVSLPSKVNLGGKTLEIPNGTSLPGTCVVGEQFMDTDATSGSRHYLCESTNTWALQGGGGAPAFSAITTATNTTATMTVGAGASVEPASTGTIKATTQSQVFTADGTYTPGPGVTRVLVKVLGGGGGGNAGGFGASGNGGGGGAYVEKICEVTPGSGVTVTVGDGSAGATGSNNGTQGESSSFGTCAVALGGMGGQRSASRAGIGGLDDDIPPVYIFYQRGTAGSALSATPTFATYSDFANASNLGAYTTAGNCANTETAFVPFHHSAGGIGGLSKTTNDGTGCPGNRGMMGAGGGGGGGRGTSNAGGAGGTSGNPFAGSGGTGGTHGAAGSAASANTGGGGGGGGDDGATFRDGGAGGSGKVEVIVI